jgi:uncharacterized repeat protein (TIGR03806 family)
MIGPPMKLRRASRTFPWLIALSVSCSSTDETTVPPVDDPSDASVADRPPPSTEVEFGLERRPENPSCVAGPPVKLPATDVAIRVAPAFPNIPFGRTVFALQAPANSSRWFFVEQPGRVRVFPNSPSTADVSTFIDITDRVDDGPGEAGLLGMAFHPDWPQTPEVFLSYTGQNNGLESRLSRFVSRDGGTTLDSSSEVILLRQPQFADNHNGGWIGFGPDRYLYMAFGDGGGSGDPQRTGQDLRSLLGKILRLDVIGRTAYAIPPGNPFVSTAGARPEIYALGFRNPWRLSFDRATGDLWAGDVGQSEREEVDRVRLGGNYGWSNKEGTRCFRSPCDNPDFIDPVAEYGHGEGQSITGGYVYRGAVVPALDGVYLYGDFGSGTVWGLFQEDNGDYRSQPLLQSGRNIASFAEGADGELYLVDIGNGLYRILPDGDQTTGTLPAKLSETGCFDPTDPRKPGPGLIPYGVQAQFWSDGAKKERYLALPDESRVTIEDNGDWSFPIGTVLLKTFQFDGVYIETRFFMRHTNGDWAGYTYRWNEDQTDAELTSTFEDVPVGEQTWQLPSRAQCMQCHTGAAGRSLGLETSQLNGNFAYPGGLLANQLKTLDHIGVFDQPLEQDPATLPRLPAYDDAQASVASRSRAYLHSNCSGCHRPGGPAQGSMDLRFTTPIENAGLCNQAPQVGDLGVPDARLISPGRAEASILWLRMQALDSSRMPPLSSNRVDTEALELLRVWIDGSPCP